MTIRAAVIGLGFMGRTHVTAYRRAYASGYPVSVVAVCDRHPERINASGAGGNLDSMDEGPLIDPDTTRIYDDPAEILADDEVDLVSICTPTDTHVDLTLAAIEAGKHVLVEKPMAVRSADAIRIADAARKSDRICMPAMCIRFWPAYAWLKNVIDSREFGHVRSARFERVGSAPAWADFYADESRSGGAITDVHIHDADFVRFAFGEPKSVVSAGTTNHLTALYHFDADSGGAPHVAAEGGWAHQPGFGYRMRYTVSFERATADFDLAGFPALAEPGDIPPQVRLCIADEAQAVDIPPGDGYEWQARHLLDAIAAGRTEADVTPDDAVNTARLIEAERESLRTGAPVAFG